MTSNPEFNNKTTGTEAAQALGDSIKGKNGLYLSLLAFSYSILKLTYANQQFSLLGSVPPQLAPPPRWPLPRSPQHLSSSPHAQPPSWTL